MQPTRRTTLLAGAAGLAAAAVGTRAALAAKAPVYTGFLSNTAVGGHDPVAYFAQGRPVEGSRSHVHRWQGVDWRFASAENLRRFAADPERYAPRFGGYCAWAVAQGYTAAGNPRFWRVVDGRLYLNFDANVQRMWEADIPGFIARAERNWPGVLSS